MTLSVVIPSYRGMKSLEQQVFRLEQILAGRLDFEIIVVDDGSPDFCSTRAETLCHRHPLLRIRHLEKNRGQQIATLYGLKAAQGKICLTMDDDGEHPADILFSLIQTIEEGNDAVFAMGKSSRNFYRTTGSFLRNLLFRFLFHCPKGVRVSSYRALSRSLVDQLLKNPEYFRYLSVEILRHTRSLKTRTYPQPSQEKNSRYTFSSLLSLGWNLFKAAFSRKPTFPLRTPCSDFPRKTRPLLVVGGGPAQVYAIRRFRKSGLPVYSSDQNPDAPAKLHCMGLLQADTFSPKATLDAARSIDARAICTLGTDQPVLSVAHVAAVLGLPCGLNEEAALAVTNKRIMKPRLVEAGIPTNPYALITPGEKNLPEQLSFPMVLKPVDSQGQRGVVRVENREDIRKALPKTLSFSREDAALLEEYYPSAEITVSGWSIDGRFFPLTVTDRITRDFPPHIGVCFAHQHPSRFLHEYQQEILQISEEVVDAFSIRQGPVYLQLLIGNQGIRVNEVAARIGGAYEDRFIPALTGIDLLLLQLHQALGLPVSPSVFRNFSFPSPLFGTVLLFFAEPCRVSAVGRMEDVLKLPGVLYGEYLVEPGTIIPPRTDSTGRAGFVIFTASDGASRSCLLKKVYDRLVIKDQYGNNVVSREEVECEK